MRRPALIRGENQVETSVLIEVRECRMGRGRGAEIERPAGGQGAVGVVHVGLADRAMRAAVRRETRSASDHDVDAAVAVDIAEDRRGAVHRGVHENRPAADGGAVVVPGKDQPAPARRTGHDLQIAVAVDVADRGAGSHPRVFRGGAERSRSWPAGHQRPVVMPDEQPPEGLVGAGHDLEIAVTIEIGERRRGPGSRRAWE
jgi:hypothetical protein